MNAQLQSFELDVEDALHQLDTGWGMPTRWYHDADVFRFEMDTIYGREWQYLAPTARLSEPGDYVVGQAAEIPVFVVRARDGELRGLSTCAVIEVTRSREKTVTAAPSFAPTTVGLMISTAVSNARRELTASPVLIPTSFPCSR